MASYLHRRLAVGARLTIAYYIKTLAEPEQVARRFENAIRYLP